MLIERAALNQHGVPHPLPSCLGEALQSEEVNTQRDRYLMGTVMKAQIVESIIAPNNQAGVLREPGVPPVHPEVREGLQVHPYRARPAESGNIRLQRQVATHTEDTEAFPQIILAGDIFP